MTEYGLNTGHQMFLFGQFLINLSCNDVSIWYGSNSIYSVILISQQGMTKAKIYT